VSSRTQKLYIMHVAVAVFLFFDLLQFLKNLNNCIFTDIVQNKLAMENRRRVKAGGGLIVNREPRLE